MPRAQGRSAHDERLTPDKPLLVYCAVGPRSALAAAALQELGSANVTNLEVGLVAWENAGYPVERREVARVG